MQSILQSDSWNYNVYVLGGEKKNKQQKAKPQPNWTVF